MWVNFANRFQMVYAISSWLLATCSWCDRANDIDTNPLRVKIASCFSVSESASCQTPIASINNYKIQLPIPNVTEP